MAANGGAIVTFIFNGEDRDDIPRDITHLIIHENITVIPERLFSGHPNLVEVYCHAGVIKIERRAFEWSPALQRVIIPGVITVEADAFYGCRNLMYVECDKLERIGVGAFGYCESLSSINFPSAVIVEESAFSYCRAMTKAIFGKDLESFEGKAFVACRSLESITIPLRSGLFTRDNIFKECFNLRRVYLVGGEALHDFANALLLESWSDDVNGKLDSINQILSNTDAGGEYYSNVGGKAIAIREWTEGVLRKVIRYKAAHRDLLNEAASALQLLLPTDTVLNNILPFVELPPHAAFEGERGG